MNSQSITTTMGAVLHGAEDLRYQSLPVEALEPKGGPHFGAPLSVPDRFCILDGMSQPVVWSRHQLKTFLRLSPGRAGIAACYPGLSDV